MKIYMHYIKDEVQTDFIFESLEEAKNKAENIEEQWKSDHWNSRTYIPNNHLITSIKEIEIDNNKLMEMLIHDKIFKIKRRKGDWKPIMSDYNSNIIKLIETNDPSVIIIKETIL